MAKFSPFSVLDPKLSSRLHHPPQAISLAALCQASTSEKRCKVCTYFDTGLRSDVAGGERVTPNGA